jgi:hypothetical protein
MTLLPRVISLYVPFPSSLGRVCGSAIVREWEWMDVKEDAMFIQHPYLHVLDWQKLVWM